VNASRSSVDRRRDAARAARRRRLALVDALLGVALAVLVLILGLGVAPAGILALLVLIVCAGSFALGRRRGP
jgi:hypothetical protein